jgi:hypothetical protein
VRVTQALTDANATIKTMKQAEIRKFGALESAIRSYTSGAEMISVE